MERRLRMMIAGSIAVWVPVASAAEAHPALVDLGKVYRLKAQPASDAPSTTEGHAR
ncbi:hypothetical protein ABS767_10905 [Sphingomonas sp. ST-64]|uniref:Uncharacterized protein n=1 Tax=Sphingomonas plantiphila TaxID=3163295 RepID=A0ABW8YQW5_9SPHN